MFAGDSKEVCPATGYCIWNKNAFLRNIFFLISNLTMIFWVFLIPFPNSQEEFTGRMPKDLLLMMFVHPCIKIQQKVSFWRDVVKTHTASSLQISDDCKEENSHSAILSRVFLGCENTPARISAFVPFIYDLFSYEQDIFLNSFSSPKCLLRDTEALPCFVNRWYFPGVCKYHLLLFVRVILLCITGRMFISWSYMG